MTQPYDFLGFVSIIRTLRLSFGIILSGFVEIYKIIDLIIQFKFCRFVKKIRTNRSFRCNLSFFPAFRFGSKIIN